MRPSVWICGAALSRVVLGEATGHPLANIVKLLEKVQGETKEAMDLEEKTLSDFECAKKKAEKTMTAQKEEAEAALKAAQEELDMVNNGAALTDEASVLSAKIQDLDKQIEAKVAEIGSEKTKADDAVAALIEGQTALANAITKLSAPALIEMSSTVHHLVAPSTLDALPAATRDSLQAVLKQSATMTAESEAALTKQAPEQYEQQAGTVKKFMNELMTGYKKEQLNVEQDWGRTDAALKAEKESLEKEKAEVQAQAAGGAREAAAKAAKVQELTDTITLSNTLIKQANDEIRDRTNEYNTALQNYQTAMSDLEAQMQALGEALNVLTSEEARDKRDTLSAAVFLQTRTSHRSSVNMETLQSVFQVIISHIDTFVGDLEQQSTEIENAIKNCETTSKQSLQTMRDLAVKHDQNRHKRDNAQEQVDVKASKIESLTKQMGVEVEDLAAFVKNCNDEVTDLQDLEQKHSDVLDLIRQAKGKLMGYPDAAQKFKTVFALFDAEITKSQTEVTNLQKDVQTVERKKQDEKTRVGNTDKLTEDRLKEIGNCDNLTLCPGDNVICGLRKSISDLCTGKSQEETKRNNREGEMLSGKTSLDSAFKQFADNQPVCDMPMVNGPAMLQSNAQEIDELKQAKIVLASFDTQDLGQGEKYADTNTAIASADKDAVSSDWSNAASSGNVVGSVDPNKQF